MQVDTEDKWTLFVKLNPGEDKGDSPYQDFAQIEVQLGGCKKQNDLLVADDVLTKAQCAEKCLLSLDSDGKPNCISMELKESRMGL